MPKKKSTSHNMRNASIGVGITAAAAAAAGAYFLYGSKNAKQNRQKVKSWTLKAKAEALEALEKAEKMTQKEYEQLIDKIGRTYAVVKDASKADIAAFQKEMKAYWKSIENVGKKPAKKAAKKATKKAAKKAPKKNAKKAAKKKK